MAEFNDFGDFVGLSEVSKDGTLWRAAVAEFFGTMFVVLVGCASCISGWTVGYEPSEVQIAFTFGIIVATMVQCLCHVSGGHVNPAVTCGFLVARRISLIRAALYIMVECAGAVVGAAILAGLVPSDLHGTLGTTTPNEAVNAAQAFGVELMITLVLVLTVFAVCDEDRKDVHGSAPLAIGFSVTACHLAAIPITGSSMNPARSFGPAVISGIWDSHWIYWVGPLPGGIIAALVYTYLFRAKLVVPERQSHEELSRSKDFQSILIFIFIF